MSGILRKAPGIFGMVAWIFWSGSCLAKTVDFSRAPPLQQARMALDILSEHYARELHTHHDGDAFHAWQRFVSVGTLMDYEAASGDSHFHALAGELLADHRGLDGNDDDLWLAEAELDWAVQDGNRERQRNALKNAARIFSRLTVHAWDGACGGGVWWDHAHTYKNAITNELFIDVAARLSVMTGDASYKEWALKSWRWFEGSGMILTSHAVNDGLDARCLNNGSPTYSYNQGVILDALRNLTVLTGDPYFLLQAAQIARQAIGKRTTPDGGFREATGVMNIDSRIFRGIFVHALGRLVPALPAGEDREALKTWLTGESVRLWANRFPDAQFDSDWNATPFTPSAQAQLTAASLFVAAARVSGEVAR